MFVRAFFFVTPPPKDPLAAQSPFQDISGEFQNLQEARAAAEAHTEQIPAVTCFVLEDRAERELERWLKHDDGEWKRDDAG